MQEIPRTLASKLRDPSLFVEAAAVGADWIENGPAGARIAVLDPADGSTLGHVPRPDAAQTRLAVRAAEAAWPAWRARPAQARAEILARWHQPLKNRIPLEKHSLPGDLETRSRHSSSTTTTSVITRA